MYDPRALTLAAVEEERKTLCNAQELNDIRDDTKKEEEHIYPVISPAQFNRAITPISPVYVCLNFFKPHYTQSFFLVTIVFQSSPTQKTSNPLRFLVWISPLTLSSLSYLLSPLPRNCPLTQLRLTRRLLLPYRRLFSLQL